MDIDGYCINVYDDRNNKISELSDMMYTADGKSATYKEDGSIKKSGKASKDTDIEVGGKYEYENPETHEKITVGLKESEKYTVGVSTFKISDKGIIIYSKEKKSSALTIENPVETVFEIKGDSETVNIDDERKSADGSSIKFETPYYKKSNVILTVNTSNNITGTWSVDGGNREQDKGKIKDKNTFIIDLKSLDEGTHTLEITGNNSHGDAIRNVYTFGVDTEGPRLLISSPVSGEFFDNNTGSVKITGVTDYDTELIITDKNSGAVYGKYQAVPVNESGIFEADIIVDKTKISHTLLVKAKDRAGNVTEKDISLISSAMGMIKSVDIYSEDMLLSDKIIASGATYPLKMFANLADGSKIDITESRLVEWNHNTIDGKTEIIGSADSTKIVVGENAVGTLTGRFRVSDAGSYSATAAFKDTGSINIKNAVVNIPESKYYTGNEIKLKPRVFVNGILLNEGTDYSISYRNNINVTTDKSKAVIIIKGQGEYNGSVSKDFDIVYLESEGTYTVSGIDGDNGWSTSGIKIKPDEGYQISDTSQTKGYSDSTIKVTKQGSNSVTFYIRRVVDGAISDKITVNTKVDSSAPEGKIAIDGKAWSTFQTPKAFAHYNLKDKSFSINGSDKVSGIESSEYVLLNNSSYKTVEELLDAKPEWTLYDKNDKPSAKEDKKLTLYAKIKDKAGNVIYLNSDGILMDTKAPEITSVEMKNDETLMLLQADIGFVVSEPGKYYYAVVKSDEKVPTAEEIISGDI